MRYPRELRGDPQQIKFPPGYYVTWSGQFEYMERAIEKMKVVIPVTLLSIFLLLYLNFRRITETLIVMLSVPFALVGGVWLMWALGYNLSVAVAVGFIALAGVAAETGVIMLIYLDHAWEDVKDQCRQLNRAPTVTDLYGAVMEGAVERVRPKMMTVVAIMAGLLPIMWGTGTAKMGAVYKNTTICEALVWRRPSPSNRNSSPNSSPTSTPGRQMPSASAMRSPRTAISRPTGTAAAPERRAI